MDFDEYQKLAKKTALYPEIGKGFVYPTLGLVGESGEIAEKVKKIFRDEGGKFNPQTRKDLTKELGDVLWYLAQLATELDLSLSEIAKQNIAKLASRQKRNKLHGSGDNR